MSDISALIEVYKMESISDGTKVNLIIKLGVAINCSMGSNFTEPLVWELVKSIDPNHEIITNQHYLFHIKS